MAVKLGAHLGSDDDLAIQHEINVTPFIDVILVLLIIFMVAAPLATVDIGVDLPASTAQQQPRPDKPVFVTVKSATSRSPSAKPSRRARGLPVRSMPQPTITATSASSCAPTRLCPTAS